MLDANATVTVCHSKTRDLARVASEADILVSAIGRAKMVDAEYVKRGAVVVDVGINDDGRGGICGDVDEDSVTLAGISAITPVPGGIGGVTTTLLARNVVMACEKIQKI
jgi:methylenetetrahydrofolate dehydrogenase (NADP+)/methenyltetrahydrofolate cyclohydrolase